MLHLRTKRMQQTSIPTKMLDNVKPSDYVHQMAMSHLRVCREWHQGSIYRLRDHHTSCLWCSTNNCTTCLVSAKTWVIEELTNRQHITTWHEFLISLGHSHLIPRLPYQQKQQIETNLHPPASTACHKTAKSHFLSECSFCMLLNIINITIFNTAGIAAKIISYAAYNQYSVRGVICILFILVMKQTLHTYAKLRQQK